MADRSATELRAIRPGDVEALHRLSSGAGWLHRPEDWRLMIGLGSGVAARDADGHVVGCAMWWPNGSEYGTVGMVIVAPAMQGRGLGRRLMAAVLAEAGGRTLALNATVAGRALYEREGFVPTGTIRQFQGLATPLPEDATRLAAGGIRPVEGADMPAVLRLDRAATGRDRSDLLRRLLTEARGVVHDLDGDVAGFVFTRPFGRGHVVGPLVAGSDAAATALLAPSLVTLAGRLLRTDTVLDDGSYLAVLHSAGLSQVSTALTMVRGAGLSEVGPARAYALTSQAFG